MGRDLGPPPSRMSPGSDAGATAGEPAIGTLDRGRLPDEPGPASGGEAVEPPGRPGNDDGRRSPRGDHPHDDRRPENAR
jgi:hypothetical protein